MKCNENKVSVCCNIKNDTRQVNTTDALIFLTVVYSKPTFSTVSSKLLVSAVAFMDAFIDQEFCTLLRCRFMFFFKYNVFLCNFKWEANALLLYNPDTSSVTL